MHPVHDRSYCSGTQGLLGVLCVCVCTQQIWKFGSVLQWFCDLRNAFAYLKKPLQPSQVMALKWKPVALSPHTPQIRGTFLSNSSGAWVDVLTTVDSITKQREGQKKKEQWEGEKKMIWVFTLPPISMKQKKKRKKKHKSSCQLSTCEVNLRIFSVQCCTSRCDNKIIGHLKVTPLYFVFLVITLQLSSFFSLYINLPYKLYTKWGTCLSTCLHTNQTVSLPSGTNPSPFGGELNSSAFVRRQGTGAIWIKWKNPCSTPKCWIWVTFD